MQQIANVMGYGPGSTQGNMADRPQRSQPTVLVSQPSPELTDRMYADLVDSLRYSRDAAERRANDAERRAQIAEERLHDLQMRVSTHSPSAVE